MTIRRRTLAPGFEFKILLNPVENTFFYHSSFNPNCTCRELVEVEVITPAVAEGSTVLPTLSVMIARIVPISTFFTLTIAPAMRAPVGSVTAPLIEASPWAQAMRGATARSSANKPAIIF
jgi:hypothetical protein